MVNTEKQVRDLLAFCARTGTDPYLALDKARLLWDERTVLRTRADTLRLAAQAIREKSPTSYPFGATRSPGGMRDYLTGYLEELADLQEVKRGKSKEEASGT